MCRATPCRANSAAHIHTIVFFRCDRTILYMGVETLFQVLSRFHFNTWTAVSRILKTRNLLQTLTKSSRLLWPPTSSQRQLGGQLFFITKLWRVGGCDDNDYFLYMLLQLFAMHKPRLQAPSDSISDVFDSLDPSPQHRSCCQFK